MPKGEEREDIDVLEEGADQRRDLHGTGGCARTPRSAPPSSNSGFASFVSVSTQTDIVGASAYMQYMSDMPQGGTIGDLPDIASFMCDAHAESARPQGQRIPSLAAGSAAVKKAPTAKSDCIAASARATYRYSTWYDCTRSRSTCRINKM
jgi:hypothetical protein